MALPDSDALMRAMVTELTRSMDKLALDDLPRPYFIQYTAEDRVGLLMRAQYGGIVASHDRRSRILTSRVRVGSYELDNTHVGRGGLSASLPLDDDEIAIRHAIWRITDVDYKRAVEILTRKKAYLRDKTMEDRPDDFSKADPVTATEPSAEIMFDRAQWEHHLASLSARFARYREIQNSGVVFFAGAVNKLIVHSEGTRLRLGDTGVLIDISAELQAKEGMRLFDGLHYLGERFDQLPPIDTMAHDIDEMCGKLVALSKAPILEQYTGPVLFEPVAAGKVFSSLLAEGICARPQPLGGGGRSSERSLEKKIGLRILPRSFQVYDDQTTSTFEGTVLAGAHTYDDEGVAPHRVVVVENGILRHMLASRSPTRKVKHSTGHAQRGGSGDPIARIGCLYLEDRSAVSAEELKEQLLEAASEEGLEYGLRVESLASGGPNRLGRPIYVYKVYVSDGHEELVRGLEFLPVPTRSLKRILAAGKNRKVYNSFSDISGSMISPAILFEELELKKLEEVFDKLPILPPPRWRN